MLIKNIKFVTQLLDLFKNQKCLWDMNCPYYNNSSAMENSITKILVHLNDSQSLRNLSPITFADVITTMNELTRRLKSHIKNLEHSSGFEDNFIYFEQMRFMHKFFDQEFIWDNKLNKLKIKQHREEDLQNEDIILERRGTNETKWSNYLSQKNNIHKQNPTTLNYYNSLSLIECKKSELNSMSNAAGIKEASNELNNFTRFYKESESDLNVKKVLLSKNSGDCMYLDCSSRFKNNGNSDSFCTVTTPINESREKTGPKCKASDKEIIKKNEINSQNSIKEKTLDPYFQSLLPQSIKEKGVAPDANQVIESNLLIPIGSKERSQLDNQNNFSKVMENNENKIPELKDNCSKPNEKQDQELRLEINLKSKKDKNNKYLDCGSNLSKKNKNKGRISDEENILANAIQKENQESDLRNNLRTPTKNRDDQESILEGYFPPLSESNRSIEAGDKIISQVKKKSDKYLNSNLSRQISKSRDQVPNTDAVNEDNDFESYNYNDHSQNVINQEIELQKENLESGHAKRKKKKCHKKPNIQTDVDNNISSIIENYINANHNGSCGKKRKIFVNGEAEYKNDESSIKNNFKDEQITEIQANKYVKSKLKNKLRKNGNNVEMVRKEESLAKKKKKIYGQIMHSSEICLGMECLEDEILNLDRVEADISKLKESNLKASEEVINSKDKKVKAKKTKKKYKDKLITNGDEINLEKTKSKKPVEGEIEKNNMGKIRKSRKNKNEVPEVKKKLKRSKSEKHKKERSELTEFMEDDNCMMNDHKKKNKLTTCQEIELSKKKCKKKKDSCGKKKRKHCNLEDNETDLVPDSAIKRHQPETDSLTLEFHVNVDKKVKKLVHYIQRVVHDSDTKEKIHRKVVELFM